MPRLQKEISYSINLTNLKERRTYLMKEWIANNKGISIIMVIVLTFLLVAVVAGPSIWAAILTAHGM